MQTVTPQFTVTAVVHRAQAQDADPQEAPEPQEGAEGTED